MEGGDPEDPYVEGTVYDYLRHSGSKCVVMAGASPKEVKVTGIV